MKSRKGTSSKRAKVEQSKDEHVLTQKQNCCECFNPHFTCWCVYCHKPELNKIRSYLVPYNTAIEKTETKQRKWRKMVAYLVMNIIIYPTFSRVYNCRSSFIPDFLNFSSCFFNTSALIINLKIK